MLPIIPSHISHGHRKLLLQVNKHCSFLLLLQVKSVGCWGLPPFPSWWRMNTKLIYLHNISAWKSSYSWEAGALIWVLAGKGKNRSQIFSAVSALYNRLLNCTVRRKAALPFQQLLTEAVGAVFCMKPRVLGAIWASFLGQTSDKEEHLVWDVCRWAVMTKLFL